MNDIANGDEQTAAKAKETLLNDTKGKIDTLFDHVVNERTSLGVRVSTAEKIKELNDEDILIYKMYFLKLKTPISLML